jgi:hypothetical protein
MRELAGVRVRAGYRQLHTLLFREGWQVNRKRVYRLYTDEGLTPLPGGWENRARDYHQWHRTRTTTAAEAGADSPDRRDERSRRGHVDPLARRSPGIEVRDALARDGLRIARVRS